MYLGSLNAVAANTESFAFGDVSHSLPVSIGVGDDHHPMSQLDQTQRQLEDVTLHSPHVGVEEVAHHADVVTHLITSQPIRLDR